MIESFSLKKRLKGLMALALATLTVVTVFPPIKAQAISGVRLVTDGERIGRIIDIGGIDTPSSQNIAREAEAPAVPDDYYLFLTGFSDDGLNSAYLVKTNEEFYFGALYGYLTSDPTFNDYPTFVNNAPNASGGYANILSTFSLDEDTIGQTGSFTVSDDSELLALQYTSGGIFAAVVNGNFMRYIGSNSPFDYEALLPSGTYNVEYSRFYDELESGYVYYLNGYSVSADDLGDSNPFVRLMYQQIKDKADEVKLAAQGLNPDGSVNATKTVYYNAPSVSAEIIKALMNTEGVSFVVTYNFAGYEFTSTITSEKAREMYNPEIAWYGPAYIAQYCGATWTGKTVE